MVNMKKRRNVLDIENIKWWNPPNQGRLNENLNQMQGSRSEVRFEAVSTGVHKKQVKTHLANRILW